MIRLPPTSTPFPYTTLFRSPPDRPRRPRAPWRLRGRHRGRRLLRDLRAASRCGGVRARGPGQARGEVSARSEEHTSELQSRQYLVCRLLLENTIKEPEMTRT